MTDGTLKGSLNDAHPNNLPDCLRALGLGDVISCTPRVVMNAPVNAANDRVELPEGAKAVAVLKAHDITNGAGMIPEPLMGTVPAAGEIAVAPNGDLVCAAADNVAALDACYVSPDADVVEFTEVPVIAGVATLPNSRRAWILLEVEITAGLDLRTINGVAIEARGAAPADNGAALNNAGTGVAFNAADVVNGTCRIRALCARTQNLTTKLALTTGF